VSHNLHKILESKRRFRHDLAARPVAEKLRLLDGLRERELAIRNRPGSKTCDSCITSRSTFDHNGGKPLFRVLTKVDIPNHYE